MTTPSDPSTWTSLPARPAALGPSVRRFLPQRQHRAVGPWVFLDQFGPATFGAAGSVGPHPHIGLQTVTWLLSGEAHHGDTVGSDQIVRPGTLSIMTAGRGIAHWEGFPETEIHGAQLWIALPDAARHVEPSFAHHADLPAVRGEGWRATVFLGSLAGATSPAVAHSPIVGAELRLQPGATAEIALRDGFEHAILVLEGTLSGVASEALHLVGGGGGLALSTDVGATVLLIGGAPLGETPLLWWNFVARTPEEIRAARAAWEDRSLIDGAPLPAPGLVAPPVPPLIG
jgi:redox-sensitive bicupin YhaK (pirin superfamily)